MIIKTTPHTIFMAKSLLGTDEIEVWIGNRPDGPLDNDDARVIKERAEDEALQAQGKARISGIAAMTVRESDTEKDWYEISTTEWQPGIYRFNIHGKANEATPFGTILRGVRDGEYSWPNISDDTLMTLPLEQQAFLYLEPNNAGFCVRVEMKEDGTILPAGNGPDWIPDWMTVKQRIEDHYKEKEAQ